MRILEWRNYFAIRTFRTSEATSVCDAWGAHHTLSDANGTFLAVILTCANASATRRPRIHGGCPGPSMPETRRGPTSASHTTSK